MWVVQVFPKLGPDTKLLLVPPTYGSHNPCTAGKPTVWCTNQTYDQWLAINRGNFVRPTDDSTAFVFDLTGVCACRQTFYRDWAFSDERIIGFDPWPLNAGGPNTSSMALGLLQLPEILAEYKALGKQILARDAASKAVGA